MGLKNSKKRGNSSASVANSHVSTPSITKFRETKSAPKGTKQEKLEAGLGQTMALQQSQLLQGIQAEEELLRKLTTLPDGESINDWLAVNTIHFYNIASMVYGTVVKQCKCPHMSAGSKYQYYWDSKDLSAQDYIIKLFDWVETQIADPTIFPKTDLVSYPSNFMNVIRLVFKRIFRMYCHVYYSHFEYVKNISAESHMNSSFQHFCFFIIEYDLMDKEDMKPLKKLLAKLLPTKHKSIL